MYLDFPGVYTDGKDVMQPLEDWCSSCGLSREAYPKLSKAELLERLKDPEFKTEFLHIARRLEATVARRVKQQQVSKDEALICEVAAKLAFVLLGEFTIRFTVPDTMKIKTATLKGPEGNDLEGVFMRLESMPDDVPYLIVTVKSQTAIKLTTFALQPQQLVRKEQAQERHDKENTKHWQALPKELRMVEWKGVESFEAKDKKFAKQQKPLAEQAVVKAAQEGSINRGGVGCRRVGGASSDEEEEEGPQQKKKARGGGGKGIQPRRSSVPVAVASSSSELHGSVARLVSAARKRVMQTLQTDATRTGIPVPSALGSGVSTTGGAAAALIVTSADSSADVADAEGQGDDVVDTGAIDYADILNGGAWGRELRPVRGLSPIRSAASADGLGSADGDQDRALKCDFRIGLCSTFVFLIFVLG